MKEKNKTWIVIVIVIAVLLLGYWIFFSPEAKGTVEHQSQEIIEDLTID